MCAQLLTRLLAVVLCLLATWSLAFAQDPVEDVPAVKRSGVARMSSPDAAPEQFFTEPLIRLSEQPDQDSDLLSVTEEIFSQPVSLQQEVPAPKTALVVPDPGSWSFNFQDAPWRLVIRNLAKQFGYSVNFVQLPDTVFTYFDDNLYTAREALDVLNDHLLTEGFIIVRNEKNLTVINTTNQVPDNLVPFVTIQDLWSLGRNEVASVAFPVRSANPTVAVQEVTELLSPLGKVQSLSESRRIIVTDTGVYLRRLRDLLLERGIGASLVESMVYPLSHASAEEVAESINDFLSGQTNEAGRRGRASSVVASVNQVVAEPTTNSLLIRGTPEEIDAVSALVQKLDRGPREVLVQAVLVEVQLGNVHEFGIELGFQDSVLFNRSVIDNLVTITETEQNTAVLASTNQTIVSQTSAPGFNFNNRATGNNTSVDPGKVGKQGLSSFGVGRVNGDLGFGGLVLSAGSESVSVLLRALDANFDINILSRPQIRTVENHEALIQIGQQVPVVDGVSVTAVGSANPVIRQEQAGIIMRVVPRISPDGRITVDVNAEKSQFNLTPGTGVPIFTDATTGNVIEAPVKDITTADTTVSVLSGQTIVLGGMITEQNTTVNRKVPWLGDLPVVGRAFRYDLHETGRTELLVLLTPVRVQDAHQQERLHQQELSRIRLPPSTYGFPDNVYGTEEYRRRLELSSQQSRTDPGLPPGRQTYTATQYVERNPSSGVFQNPASVEPTFAGSSVQTPVPVGHVRNAAAWSASGRLNPGNIRPAGYRVPQIRQSDPPDVPVTPQSWQQRSNYRGHFPGQLPRSP
ncbi:MAG: hypothetical protein MK110_18500 [Fuerstiella sp.]|nr:hypothetical protein [Fuerstiella sp.]